MSNLRIGILKNLSFLKIFIAIHISLCFISCSLIKSGVERANPFDLIITFEKSEFRPGECVICTTYIYNKSDEEQTIQKIDAQSFSFWVAPMDTNDVVRTEPVYSKKETFGQTAQLPTKSGTQRKFLFTLLTEKEGNYKFQAIYQPEPTFIKNPKPELISKPVFFTVKGEKIFNRDADGILKKEDAINIAKQRAGLNVKETEAKLVENEAGFLDWWINLTMDSGKSGKEVKKAFLVNPYLCDIRKEAKPFTKKPEPKTPVPTIPKKHEEREIKKEEGEQKE